MAGGGGGGAGGGGTGAWRLEGGGAAKPERLGVEGGVEVISGSMESR